MTIGVGAEPAVTEAVRMGIRHSVGDLNGDLDGAADVHRAAADLGPQRLPLLKLERQVHALSCSPTSNSAVMLGCDSALSPRARRSALTIDGEVAGSSRTATVRPSLVSRARKRSPGPDGSSRSSRL